MNQHISMMDVIAAAGAACKEKPLASRCPFCGSEPPLASKMNGRFFVGCENDDCDIRPQASSASLDEAWAIWNTRAA